MTDIKIFKNKNIIVGFECSGHTGYKDFGKDTLCAAISGISQAIVLGLQKVCKIDIKINRNDSSGYLKVELPRGLDSLILNKTQVLFETFELSIVDLLEGYSDYISMEVIEYVY